MMEQESTCLRHPSQILTGICSFCLAERLASVDSSANPPRGLPSEIVEIEAAAAGSGRRVRRTLLSLFELDDRSEQVGTVGPVVEKIDHSVFFKDRSGRFRFSSRWRVRRSVSQRRVEYGSGQSEGKHSSRHTWEAPRHSWDGGSVVSKAFACSFACLDEPQDGSRRAREAGPSVTDNNNVRGADNAVQGPALPDSGTRKKSRRWSRVWDWSVTSPFRDLGRKRGHVLERSLSESWREGNRVNGHASVRPKQGLNLNTSVNAVNGDLRNVSIDRQKKKEYRFGRSRSVHYSSPGNLDNGLLRFYLTPLRSSRRSTGKGRMRSSHSFARGILGLQ